MTNKIKLLGVGLAIFITFSTTGCDAIDVFNGIQTVKKAKKLHKAKRINYSEADGYYIGRRIMASFFGRYEPIFDVKLTTYLNTVGRTLAAMSERPDVWGGYHFIAYKSPQIAAFSLPGGFVLLSTGILELIDNEDQLAAVIAHELGHARWRHALEALKKEAIKKARKDLTMQVAISSGRGFMVLGGLIAGVAWENRMNSYSRKQEFEADAYSCWLMMKAGYTPLEMLNILRKMPKGKSSYCKLHPPVSKRIQYVKYEIQRYKKMSPRRQARIDRYQKIVHGYLKRRNLDKVDYADKNYRNNNSKLKNDDSQDNQDDDDNNDGDGGEGNDDSEE